MSTEGILSPTLTSSTAIFSAVDDRALAWFRVCKHSRNTLTSTAPLLEPCFAISATINSVLIPMGFVIALPIASASLSVR
ncbi:hypothetical protein ACHAWC_005288 [Mediolabrus comicus]